MHGLEDFCKQWHRKVNLSKTSVSVFDKKFQIGKQHYHFEFFGNVIAEANEYNYLDITFSLEKIDLKESPTAQRQSS